MKKLILIFIVIAMFHTSSYAQSSHTTSKFSVGWEVGIPANDFISETSFAGGRIEYQNMIKPNLSVGMAVSWNSFEEYVSKSTYQKPDGSGALTTDLIRQVYSLPLTLNVKYYHQKEGKKLTPYAGLGLGAQFSEQAIHFNIYSLYDENWGFVARPEIGLEYYFNNNNSIFLGGTYNYATNQSDAFKNDHLSHFALTLGYVFSD